MPLAEARERRLCDHCGLPVGALGYCAGGGGQFCCYGCYLAARIVGAQRREGAPAWILLRLGVGAFLAMNVMMISLLLYSEAIQDLGEHAVPAFRWGLLALSTPALLILGHPFIVGMVQELRRGRPSVDSLVALGALSAFGVSAVHVLRGAGPVYFDTATMLLLLVTLGRLLEASAKTRTAGLVRGLLEMRPPSARVARDGGEAEVPPEAVLVGEQVRIIPGERIPVDGEIVRGATTVYEAGFTGEPLPRACGPGDAVIGGSVNGEGEIVVRATAVGEGSLLAQIARLVEQAAAQKAPVERLAAKVCTTFIPAVVLTAAGVLAYAGLVQHDLARGGMSALAVLVVACPCALGIATPLVTSLAIGRAAKAGVLIRSGEILERLPGVKHILLDKTGTLTRGNMAVVDVTATDIGPERALAWVATVEQASEHPVGKAIVAAARERGLELGEVEEFRAWPGEGAVGTVVLGSEEREVRVGTAEFVGGVDLAEGNAGEMVVHATLGSSATARVTLTDTLRLEAPEVVQGLAELGVTCGMLTGDREPAAQVIARQAGITEVHAQCLPDAKIAAIRQARETGALVAMVGDGINDAPALAEADVGIAMAGGTELAREASDVTLLGDDLRRLPWVLGLSRFAYRTIRQNLGWAFGYNAIAIVIAASGHLHPLIAALAMLGSSAFVLGNSLRVARYE